MSRIRVVTDSSSGITEDTAQELGITVVPIQVQFGSDSFKEGIDLTIDEFYRRLDEPVIPTTSQPSPGDFVNAYKALANDPDCDEILSLHLTSKGSGTCQAARLAAQMIDGPRISVIDTETASLGTGLITLAAAEAVRNGASLDQVVELIRRGMTSTFVYVALPSLKYVRRCGRVPQVQAWVASLLSISPVLSMKDGLVEAIERVRTFKSAVRRTAELAEQACGGHARRLAVLHTNAYNEACGLLKDMKTRVTADMTYICDMRGSMAVHGGAGMLGVAVSGV